MIAEVYGGGGGAGATLTNDLIELTTVGDDPVSVEGWSVQYLLACTAVADPTLGPGVDVDTATTVSMQNQEDPNPTDNTGSAELATADCTIDRRDATRPQQISGTGGPEVICGSQSNDTIRAAGGGDSNNNCHPGDTINPPVTNCR